MEKKRAVRVIVIIAIIALLLSTLAPFLASGL